MTVSQPSMAVGLTHASSVMPAVRSSGVPAAPSMTVTQSSMPSNDNALPILPGTRTAPVMLPLRALGDESVAVVPLASSKPSAIARPDGPDETTNATALPGTAFVAPAGVWLMMLPRATVELFALVMAPSVRLEPVIVVVASACVVPTTRGTGTRGGPDETTNDTALPGATPLPPTGDWLMTVPAGVGWVTISTVPTVRPAFVMAVVAATCDRPPTPGTTAPLGLSDLLPSANVNSSMFRSVSVPSSAVPRVWATVTLPSALMVTS